MNKRTVIFASVVLVGVIVAVIALRGYPTTRNTQGSIGVAQRYQSPQIGEQDVALGKAEVQAFLQSDLFHKMATNPAFRQEVKNGDISRLLASEAFHELMKDQYFADLLTQEAFQATLNNSHYQALVVKEGAKELIFSDAFMTMMRDADFRGLVTDQKFAEALTLDAAREA